jgi:hypothetical protein
LTGGKLLPRRYVVGLLAFCTLLNGAGFLWDMFEPVPLYDEIAHVVTPFVLVAIVAEIVYRSGGDDEFFGTPRRAMLTGAVIGLVGATAWEGIEILLDLLFPEASIDHAPADTVFDIVLGVIGGAAGAYAADHFLDRLFNRSRTNPHRRRVR